MYKHSPPLAIFVQCGPTSDEKAAVAVVGEAAVAVVGEAAVAVVGEAAVAVVGEAAVASRKKKK